MLVVDDRSCRDILRDGDIDAVVRKAIKLGLDPIRAIQLATINPAEYFRLARLGAVAPGYYANLIVLDDLADFCIASVYYRGRLVAEKGEALFASPASDRSGVTDTVNIRPFMTEALRLKARGKTYPIIEVIPGQIITRKIMAEVRTENGFVMSDVSRDILKLVVVERHKATGNIGAGLVTGFGLKKGALASSVAHDSHNIIAVGASDADIYLAIKEIERLQGGLVVVADCRVLASLALRIAGLLSDEPLEAVVSKVEKLEKVARELGSTLPSPFAALSFLALPVIPELKLTDLGLVDVNQFKILKNLEGN
jgi:adenine deaminase